MNLSDLFPSNNWTPKQYYFPYFFNQNKFDRELAVFKLSSNVLFDKKTQMASQLIIAGSDKRLEVEFGATLMIDGDNLIIWTVEENSLTIKKVSLQTKYVQHSNGSKINLKEMTLGKNIISNDLSLQSFVTFARKEDLKYNLDYYENFVIVIISGNEVELVPFDSFNKTGGDYGYVWPAVAQLNMTSGELRGSGMRMGNFLIRLKEGCL